VTGFLPLFVQGVMGRTAAATGVALATMSISWAMASVASGRLMLRTSYRGSAVFGGAMLALGSAVLVVLAPDSDLLWASAGALMVGLGLGSCNTTYLISVQGAAALRERGSAIASNLFMRIVGQSTGAALFGALVNAGIARYAPQAVDVARQLMEPAARHGIAPTEIATLTTAMAAALRNVHIVAAVVGLIVLVLGMRLPHGLNPDTQRELADAARRADG
jgi:hypothetical protein